MAKLDGESEKGGTTLHGVLTGLLSFLAFQKLKFQVLFVPAYVYPTFALALWANTREIFI